MCEGQEVELNDLPEEILLKIFDDMNFKTLLESSLVCKKWNETIGENNSTMRKIKLVIRDRPFIQMPKKLSRNYRSIKIRGIDWKRSKYIWNEMLELIDQFGSDLRHLEIERCEVMMEDLTNFNILLESLTRLETLKISITNFDDEFKVDLSQMNRLKSLELVSNYWKILKFPETAQLANFKVSSLDGYQSPDSMIEFLVSQQNLEELAIRNCGSTLNENNNEKLQAIKFPLKKLAIHKHDNFFGSERNLLLFVDKFVDSLEELDIGSSFSASFYEMIFNKFRKLKTLRVDIDGASNVGAFCKNLRQNLSIQKLIVYGHKLEVLKSIQGIIGNVPSLQSLILENCDLSKELITFIGNNLRKLKELQVRNISDESFDGVCVPSLKKISIMKLKSNETQWTSITLALPNIEVLKVQSCEELLNEMVNIISKGWPRLKHFTFGYGFIASKRTFNQLLRNCKFLETVEICEKAFTSETEKEEILENSKRDGLRFVIHSTDKTLKFDDYGKLF